MRDSLVPRESGLSRLFSFWKSCFFKKTSPEGLISDEVGLRRSTTMGDFDGG